MLELLLLMLMLTSTYRVNGQCPIAGATIQLDTSESTGLSNVNPVLVLEGITTGGQATSVTWTWNGLVVDRNTLVGSGSFYDGGGDTIVGGSPCGSRMYRVALLVSGRLPGSYRYTVTNANTQTPVTSPIFVIEDPGPPTNILLSQISNGRVQATWTAPAGFAGATYRVYINTDVVDTGGTPVNNGTTYTTGPISTGFTFTIRIRATTGTYLSIPAVSETLTVTDSAVLPPLISMTSVTATSVTLSFSQPSNSLPVDMYAVTLTSTTCTGVPNRTESTNDNSITIGSLEADIQYSVSVTGRNNEVGLSGTATTTFTTTETAPSGSPGVPTASVIMSTSITLTWTEIDCLDRNGLITSYLIQYGEGTTRDMTVTTQSNTTTHLINGLKPFTQYTFTVAGVNSAGTGPFSGLSEIIRTSENTPTGNPGVPTVSNIRSTNIILTWTEIPASIRNGIITSYIIQYGEGITRDRTINTQSSTTTHLITGLKPFTQYTFTVAGVNSAGTGPFSGASELVITSEDSPTNSPGIPTASNIMSTSITLTWTEINLSERNGIITKYIIQYGEVTTRDQTVITQFSSTTHLITGLKPFTQYTFTVAGVNNVGTGPFSGPSGIIRTAEDKPTAVRNFQQTAMLYSVQLSWEVPEQLNGILLYYTIQYTVNETHQATQTTNNTNFTITNLTPNTLVSDITVSATTGGGEGPAVMVANITTLDRPASRVSVCVIQDILRVSPFTLRPISYQFRGTCELTVLQSCNNSRPDFAMRVDYLSGTFNIGAVGVLKDGNHWTIREDQSVLTTSPEPPTVSGTSTIYQQSGIVLTRNSDNVTLRVGDGIDVTITRSFATPGTIVVEVSLESSLLETCGICGTLRGQLLGLDGRVTKINASMQEKQKFVTGYRVPAKEQLLHPVRLECAIIRNDTIIGDPLYTVPIGTGRLNLCFEIHGSPDTIFNLISDDCITVNAYYTPVAEMNIISSIAVRAEGNNHTCRDVRVDLEKCVASTGIVGAGGLSPFSGHFHEDGISVGTFPDRVRIVVSRCNKFEVVMWVICEPARPGVDVPASLRLHVRRGVNLNPSAHGLLGQFWNIPITATPISDSIYNVTIEPANNSPKRSLQGDYFTRTWDGTNEPCIYVGNAQGGSSGENARLDDSVIEGNYKNYILNGLFETSFVYSQWESDCVAN